SAVSVARKASAAAAVPMTVSAVVAALSVVALSVVALSVVALSAAVLPDAVAVLLAVLVDEEDATGSAPAPVVESEALQAAIEPARVSAAMDDAKRYQRRREEVVEVVMNP
ncbi:MAG: hypothetical protein JWM61_1361, partial [Micrococcaceae bacterium]|nr:hypothetical protein [Micrococcaceae bacterium]